MANRTRTPVAIRLAKLTKVGGPDDCWPCIGANNGNGYAQLAGDDGRNGYAHRHAYEAAYGPIPEGMTVDHICHTPDCEEGIACPHRRCVNPAHLVLATRIDNYLRSANERVRCQSKAHRYEDHGFVFQKGMKYCLVCYNEGLARAREKAAEKRAGMPDRRIKVTPQVKEAIREAVASGLRQSDAARQWGLSTQQVSRIVKGRSDRGGSLAVQISSDTRETVKVRDGYRCIRCRAAAGENGALNLHHRQARGQGGSRDPLSASPANLLTLCGSGTTGCHGWVEFHRSQAEALGFIVRHGIDPATVPVWIDGYRWMLRHDGSKAPQP